MSEPEAIEWHRVARASEVAKEEPRAVRVGDDLIAIYNVDGTFYATADVCTHEFATLSEGYVEGDEIECPLHAGRFHIPSGKAVSAPVTEDLRTYPVKVEDGDIYVGISAD